MKKVALTAFLVLVAFVLYTFYSTGFFRTIESRFDGEIVKEIGLKGAEDIVVSDDGTFAIISATARKEFPPTEQEHGGLYLMELVSGEFVVKHLTPDFGLPFAPHGISMYRSDSVYTIAAINHTIDGHTVEFFELINEELKHIRTEKSSQFISPNDIVLLDEKRYYITNDHGYEHGIGRLVEEYGNLAIANVLYYDGQEFSIAADGISFANGINIDSERNLVFIASPRRFEVRVYQPQDDGSLEFVEAIPCGTGVDNIEFDEKGNLWVGCHPDLLHFAGYAKRRKDISPSEIIKIEYRAKGDYSVTSVYENDGSQLSATSVATPFKDLIFAGTVKDDKMLVLKLAK
ncbi:MAG: hypothetical protein ACPGU4_10515 [Flavobacteriales bacterium]